MTDLLACEWDVRPLDMKQARAFIEAHHYARITPSTTKTAYGLFVDRGGAWHLMGVSIWGYGVRPRHTIEKWFPGLGVGDYLELNRLCLLDEMPRNSESRFLSLVVKRFKVDFPQVKVLLSWADGLRGKPGYVYQAASWLYGGFIESDFYTNQTGHVIHPRLLITRYGSRDKEIQKRLQLRHYRGRQFMYCKFLCGQLEKKRLLKASPFVWGNDYPKHADLRFSVSNCAGPRETLDECPALLGRAVNADALFAPA